MKKTVSLIVSLAFLALPLVTYAASQPTFDWSGGPGHNQNMVEAKTLAAMSERAAHDAYSSGLPVTYKTQDGSVVLRAYPDYGKSKCNLVHVEALENGKFVMNTVKEVCDRNYQQVVPYVPDVAKSIPSIPNIR